MTKLLCKKSQTLSFQAPPGESLLSSGLGPRTGASSVKNTGEDGGWEC